MPQWLRGRAAFWKEAVCRPWWLVVYVVWTLFSNAATVRDNFLPGEWQKHLASSLTPRWDWKIWVIGILVITIIIVLESTYRIAEQKGTQLEQLSAELRTKKPVSLEIRPSPGEALNSFVELAHGETHYRMEIHNSGLEIVRNVQVKLVKIEPLPISEYFRARADFPYFVRLAHLADGNVDTSTDHDINPGTSEYFELLFFWESSDHRITIDGIDTKQALSRDARFSIGENECWHLKYEVSSAKNGIQRPIYFVRREGKNLSMSRLV